MTSPALSAAPAQAFDLVALAREVLRRWLLIILMVCVGLGLGYGVQRLFKPVYTGAVGLLIDPKRPNALGADVQFAGILVDSSKLASVSSLIESAGVLGRVVDAQKLANDPAYGDRAPSLLERVRGIAPFALPAPPAPAPDTAASRRARALDRLSRSVRTTRVGLTYVMKVEVSADTPAKAERLVTAVVDAYLEDQRQTKIDAARRDANWMAQQLRAAEAELVASEEAVEKIRQTYGLTETNAGPNATTDKQVIGELTAQLTQAKAEVAVRQGRFEQVERIRTGNGNLESLPEVTGSRVISDLRLALSEALRKLDNTNRNFTAAYAGIMRPEGDAKFIRGQIAAEARRIADGIATEYQAAVARRDALAAQLAAAVQTQGAASNSEGRIQFRQAQRVVDSNRAFYDAQLTRLRDLQQQETRQEAEARVISPAIAATTPSFPKPILFLGAGAGFGVLSGVGLALLRAIRSGRYANPQVIESKLAMPVLAKLPLLTRKILGANSGTLGAVDYLVSNPLSQFADSLRCLRTALGLLGPGGPRIVLITSAIPGEGKSTVAATLAVSSAIAGLRTVLVDVDIRKASLSSVFRLPRPDKDVCSSADIGANAVLHPYENLPLKVLSAGVPGHPRPDMIGSPRFKRFVRELAEEFDLVVLDTAPVLLVSDALALSDLANASLLVVEERNTQVTLVQEAARTLLAGRSPLAGIVLNKMSPIDVRPYYDRYGAGYGYPTINAAA